MSRIGIEASGLLANRPTGIGVYGRALLEALTQRGRNEYVPLCPWGRWRRRSSLGTPCRLYVSGRSLANDLPLVHTLDTRLPERYRGRLVSMVFDVLSLLPLSAELGLSRPEFRARKRRAYETIAQRAAAVVTISDASAEDIREHLRPRGEVVVVPPGVEPISCDEHDSDAAVASRLGARSPFLLAVGALCPRKNLGAVVAAFRSALLVRPEAQLVLVGEPAFGWSGSDAEKEVEALRAEDARKIHTLGYVGKKELWALYRQASLCLHLAHYEGFGLPVLEAQAAGTPVVASRRGGLTEAVGNAGWLANPDDPDEVSSCVHEALGGGTAVEHRVALGLEQAARQTWEHAAEAIENIYSRHLQA